MKQEKMLRDYDCVAQARGGCYYYNIRSEGTTAVPRFFLSSVHPEIPLAVQGTALVTPVT